MPINDSFTVFKDPVIKSGPELSLQGYAKSFMLRKRSRHRVSVSCMPCSMSKIKCEEARPCSKCVSRGLESECVNKVHQSRKKLRSSISSSNSGSELETTDETHSGSDSESVAQQEFPAFDMNLNFESDNFLPSSNDSLCQSEIFSQWNDIPSFSIDPMEDEDYNQYSPLLAELRIGQITDLNQANVDRMFNSLPIPFEEESLEMSVPEEIVSSIMKFHRRFKPKATKRLILESYSRWKGFLCFARKFLDVNQYNSLKSTLFHYALTDCHSQEQISSLQKAYLSSPSYETAVFKVIASDVDITLSPNEQKYILQAYSPQALLDGKVTFLKLSMNISENECEMVVQSNQVFSDSVGVSTSNLSEACMSSQFVESFKKQLPMLFHLLSPGMWKSYVHCGMVSWYSGMYPQSFQISPKESRNASFLINRQGNHVPVHNSICITDSIPGQDYPGSLLFASQL